MLSLHKFLHSALSSLFSINIITLGSCLYDGVLRVVGGHMVLMEMIDSCYMMSGSSQPVNH